MYIDTDTKTCETEICSYDDISISGALSACGEIGPQCFN